MTTRFSTQILDTHVNLHQRKARQFAGLLHFLRLLNV